MRRELLILRHGHAEHSNASGDAARELTDKGKRNAQRIGVWLERNQARPDYVISSTAVRSRRTAEKCCKTSGLAGSLVKLDERIYEATTADLLGVIHGAPVSTERLLLVGHNPSVESLLNFLSRHPVPRNAKGHLLSPATLVRLSFDGKWDSLEEGSADLVDVVYPRALPRLFPYPDVRGPECRSRPAYYYSQSSVVPYRWLGNQLQVLIIASSKAKHWVIPKGIHDPATSAQDSAAKEALEEAGVEGVVKDVIIGTYRYAKWDAECEVTVFPMEVTHELPVDEWRERHRGRKWVSVSEASELVLNDDVKRIVGELPDCLAKVHR